MRILAVGGGSGGHVTPIVAVLKSLRERNENLEVKVWSDASFYARTKEAIENYDASIPVEVIASGKVRRYHGVPLWKQLLRFRTIVMPNIIDIFRMIIGVIQSTYRLVRWRPDVVFCKGGFVSVPVGVAARIVSIPVVLHDSDAHPGLANTILSRWASRIGTGASLEHYNYPVSKAQYVGIPINPDFHAYRDADKAQLVAKLGFSQDKPLVVVTGGGLGAKAINDGIVAILDTILADMNVLLISGDYQYEELVKSLRDHADTTRFQLHAFLGKEMVSALAGATVVVARAGATTLLELAALAKPTILIPNPHLTGGHQTKNAAIYEEAGAVIVVEENTFEQDPTVLIESLRKITRDATVQEALSSAMHGFAKPYAARDMAQMIEEAAAHAARSERR